MTARNAAGSMDVIAVMGLALALEGRTTEVRAADALATPLQRHRKIRIYALIVKRSKLMKNPAPTAQPGILTTG